jgi:RNA-directed DNA polymerase
VDKVYKRKNLEMAWEKVKANRGSGGVDGQTLETFEAQLEQPLERLHRELGVRLNPQKTRIVHIQQGFDFLGYRMVRTSGKSKIPRGMIQRWNPKGLIAYPTRKSIRRFRDRVRMLARRSAQRKTAELIQELNPTLRGWAEYYKRAHVRTLFHKLDGWIVRRIWSHRFCRWRTRGWIQWPKAKLYAELAW